MLRALTEQEADTLIARYIEPYPGDPRLSEYRLLPEFNGYPVWSVLGSLAPDRSNVDEVARDYVLPPEAVAAVEAFYDRHRQALDDRLSANRAA